MKKIFKTLAVCAVAGTMCAGVAAVSGCSAEPDVYTGEYKYVNAYAPDSYYGVQVEVSVKDGKITEVKIADDCPYTVVTPTWGNKATWDDGVNELLGKYVGKTVEDVKKIKVNTSASGAPVNEQELGGLVITGASQGSGRLLIAVQNALNEIKTGESWGLVHSAGYVGYSCVTYKAGTLDSVTLSEVCFPDHVTAPETVPDEYKVSVEVTSHGTTSTQSYYKTVSYGSVTMTYDETAKAYKVGNQTIKEYFKEEKNAQTYYNAVIAGGVSVINGEKNDKGELKKVNTVMTKVALCKDDNKYWPNASGSVVTPAEGKTYWQTNRDNTVKYVMEHGFDNLLKLAKADPDDAHSYWMDGEISTGATWTDLNSVKDGTISYAQLLVNANNKVTK